MLTIIFQTCNLERIRRAVCWSLIIYLYVNWLVVEHHCAVLVSCTRALCQVASMSMITLWMHVLLLTGLMFVYDKLKFCTTNWTFLYAMLNLYEAIYTHHRHYTCIYSVATSPAMVYQHATCLNSNHYYHYCCSLVIHSWSCRVLSTETSHGRGFSQLLLCCLIQVNHFEDMVFTTP